LLAETATLPHRPHKINMPHSTWYTPGMPSSTTTGRPTVMTEPVIRKLEEAFKVDATDEETCSYAGIAEASRCRSSRHGCPRVWRRSVLSLLAIVVGAMAVQLVLHGPAAGGEGPLGHLTEAIEVARMGTLQPDFDVATRDDLRKHRQPPGSSSFLLRPTFMGMNEAYAGNAVFLQLMRLHNSRSKFLAKLIPTVESILSRPILADRIDVVKVGKERRPRHPNTFTFDRLISKVIRKILQCNQGLSMKIVPSRASSIRDS